MARFLRSYQGDNIRLKKKNNMKIQRVAAVAVPLYSGCVSHATDGPCCLCLPPPYYLLNPNTNIYTHTSQAELLGVMGTYPLTFTAELFCLPLFFSSRLCPLYVFFGSSLHYYITLLLKHISRHIFIIL